MISPAWIVGITTVLIVVVLRLFRRNITLFWMLALPGVILHELCHWMVAFVTFGQPGFPRFIPKKIGNVYALGRVPIHNPRWYNGALIGLAPLMMIPVAYYAILYGAPESYRLSGIWRFLVDPLVAAECLLECVPSSADLHLVRKSIVPLALVGLGAYIGWQSGFFR